MPPFSDKLNNLRKGIFDDDDADLKCYTGCIAEMAGTVTKKKELSAAKTLAQLDILAPAELKDEAKAAISSCKDVRKCLRSLFNCFMQVLNIFNCNKIFQRLTTRLYAIKHTIQQNVLQLIIHLYLCFRNVFVGNTIF